MSSDDLQHQLESLQHRLASLRSEVEEDHARIAALGEGLAGLLHSLPEKMAQVTASTPEAPAEPVTASVTRSVIRISTGQCYRGQDERGAPRWTYVPRWFHVFADPRELSEVVSALESAGVAHLVEELPSGADGSPAPAAEAGL
jgi:hypothetical protein